jgi:hypothetical protein
VIVIEVNVKCRVYFIAERVLEIREALREVANMMVVDEREGRDRVRPCAYARAGHLRANEVAEKLRARAPSVLDEPVKLAKKRAFHRDSEPNQTVLHRGPS